MVCSPSRSDPVCRSSGWVAVPQDKPPSALILHRLQFFRTWPPALVWGPQQAAVWITAPSQVPSMGCTGNFCCGAWSAFPPSCLTLVLQDYFSQFCFPHSLPCAECCSPNSVALVVEGSAVPCGHLLQPSMPGTGQPWPLLMESSLGTPIATYTWYWESWEKQASFTLNCVRGSKTQRNKTREIVSKFYFNYK